jgi:hypothetical protein
LLIINKKLKIGVVEIKRKVEKKGFQILLVLNNISKKIVWKKGSSKNYE